MGWVTHIFYKTKDGELVSHQEIYADDKNFNSRNESRQVSLISLKGYKEIKSGTERGFCHNRFLANFILDVDFPGNVKKNVQIAVGEGIFTVMEAGKECHTQCPLITKGKGCSLQREIAFATICQEGIVKVGDKVSFLNN